MRRKKSTRIAGNIFKRFDMNGPMNEHSTRINIRRKYELMIVEHKLENMDSNGVRWWYPSLANCYIRFVSFALLLFVFFEVFLLSSQ